MDRKIPVRTILRRGVVLGCTKQFTHPPLWGLSYTIKTSPSCMAVLIEYDW